MGELTGKQLAWANAYLETYNKTEASRRAGYKGNDATLANVGYQNYRKLDIQEYIKRRLEEKAMSADEVLSRLADFARADISDFITFVDDIKLPFIDLKKAKEAGKLHLVKKIKYNAQGMLEFELHDPVPPLLNIGKQHGLFKEIREHSGAVGTYETTLEEWRKDQERRRNEVAETLAVFDNEE